MGLAGSTIAKVLQIWKDRINAFKARLDKIWLHQADKFAFTADLTTKLYAPLLVLLGSVGLGQPADGLG